jgi:hypothetical protein
MRCGRSCKQYWLNATLLGPRGIGGSICAGCSRASSFVCAPVAHGINGPSDVATTAPCIGTSSAGVNWASSNSCGLCGYKPVTSWAGSTGHGQPPIPRWATLGWVGTWWGGIPPTAGKRGETPPRSGSRWRSTWDGHCGSQRPRYQVTRAAARGHGRRAASPNGRGASASLSGSGLRYSHGRSSGPGVS